MRTSTAVGVVVATMCVACSLAQQRDCTVRTLRLQFSTPVSVLTASMLRPELNKERVEVESVEPAKPIRLLIVLDASSSMDGSKWTTALDIVEHLMYSAPTELPVGFFAHMQDGGDLQVQIGPQSRRQVLQVAADLRKTTPTGMTPLFDSVERAFADMSSHEPGDLIIVVTDGIDNESKHSRETLDRLLAESDTELDVVFLMETNTLGSGLEDFGRWSLGEISDHTGGRSISIRPYGIKRDLRLSELHGVGNLVSRPRWRAMLKTQRPPGSWGHLKVKFSGLPTGTIASYPILWSPCVR